jgi:hypothetical protein
MLTDRELQELRNQGRESKLAAEEIEVLRRELNAADELINALYASGCLDMEREHLVRTYIQA